MGSNRTIEKPVVLFDGVCNLCESSVQFIIRNDKAGKFRFASLQSAYAETNLSLGSIVKDDDLKSIILQQGNELKTKSTAVLTIAKDLSGLWPVLYVFIVVPKFLRDWIYDIVAKNRYRWFGKKDQCMIPTPELRSRFYD